MSDSLNRADSPSIKWRSTKWWLGVITYFIAIATAVHGYWSGRVLDAQPIAILLFSVATAMLGIKTVQDFAYKKPSLMVKAELGK